MAETHETPEPLTEEELERANAEPLPDREVMTTLDPSQHLGPPVPDIGNGPVTTLPVYPVAE